MIIFYGQKGTDKVPYVSNLSIFHDKKFDYINISSISHLDNVQTLFPNKLKTDEPPFVVYRLKKEVKVNSEMVKSLHLTLLIQRTKSHTAQP